MSLDSIVDSLFLNVFRTSFEQPGFALWKLGAIDSHGLRRRMIELKLALSDRCLQRFGKHLGYLSLARFNQQVTTKFHLDGAPDESYLMLGYEPTQVPSRLALADYSRAAFDLGITPREYLERFNPMFPVHAARLAPFVTHLEAFDPSQASILLINNSALPYSPEQRNSLGVMHQATIAKIMPDVPRIINSTMLGVFASADMEPRGPEAQQWFVATDEISGRDAYAT